MIENEKTATFGALLPLKNSVEYVTYVMPNCLYTYYIIYYNCTYNGKSYKSPSNVLEHLSKITLKSWH